MIRVTIPQSQFTPSLFQGIRSGESLIPDFQTTHSQQLANLLARQRLDLLQQQQESQKELLPYQIEALKRKNIPPQLQILSSLLKRTPGVEVGSLSSSLPTSALPIHSLLGDTGAPQDEMFGGMAHYNPVLQGLISKTTGIPTVAQQLAQFGPDQQKIRIANMDKELATKLNLDPTAAAVSWANKNLSAESKNILAGTHTFLPLYNKDIVPLAQSFINLLDSQGALAKGKIEGSKLASFLGKKAPLYTKYVTLLNALKDLSASYRQAGGDRATMGQINLNIQQLSDEFKKGNIRGAVSTLNKLSKMVYHKGHGIIEGELNPVRSSYPAFETPAQLYLPQDLNTIMMKSSDGSYHRVPQDKKDKALKLGWIEVA